MLNLISMPSGLMSDQHGAAPTNAMLDLLFPGCGLPCPEPPSLLTPIGPMRERPAPAIDPDQASFRERRLTALEERFYFGCLRRLERRLARSLAEVEISPGSADQRREPPELRVLRCQVTRVRQTLIASYFKLAVAVARAFASRPQDIDDLVGQACVTLIRAVDLFDVDRGVRFSTYATRAIRTELSRFIIRRRKRAMRCVDPRLLWRHPDRHGRGGNGAAGILAILEPMLERLDPREASILRSRFGLNEIPGNTTLQAVADGLGISRERVRQLESGGAAQASPHAGGVAVGGDATGTHRPQPCATSRRRSPPGLHSRSACAPGEMSVFSGSQVPGRAKLTPSRSVIRRLTISGRRPSQGAGHLRRRPSQAPACLRFPRRRRREPWRPRSRSPATSRR